MHYKHARTRTRTRTHAHAHTYVRPRTRTQMHTPTGMGAAPSHPTRNLTKPAFLFMLALVTRCISYVAIC